MAQKINDKDLVSLNELLMANSIQVDTLAQFLIEKGVIYRQEFYTKPKGVHSGYESKKVKEQ
jgi:hypothetical protein